MNLALRFAEGPRSRESKRPSHLRPANEVSRLNLGFALLLLLFGGSLTALAQGRDESVAPPATPSPERAAEARAVNQRGVDAFSRGQLEDALTAFREANRLDPENPVIRRNIARCHAHIGMAAAASREFRKAAEDFKLAEDFEPGQAEYGLSRGRALNDGAFHAEAEQVLRELLKRFPKLAAAYTQLGISLYNLDRLEDAIQSFDKALALDPKDATATNWKTKASREDSVEKSLDTDLGAPHFVIKFDGSADAGIGRRVGALLEAAYEEVGRQLGKYPESPVAVVVYSGKSFQAVTGVYGWVGALYDGKIRVPGASLASLSDDALGRILRHEYSHAVVTRLAGSRCPVWFHEGLAQLLEGGDQAAARRVLVELGAPTLEELSGSFVKVRDPRTVRRLYAAALLLVQDLVQNFGGLHQTASFLEDLARGESFPESIKDRLRQDLPTLYADWRARAGLK